MVDSTTVSISSGPSKNNVLPEVNKQMTGSTVLNLENGEDHQPRLPVFDPRIITHTKIAQKSEATHSELKFRQKSIIFVGQKHIF